MEKKLNCAAVMRYRLRLPILGVDRSPAGMHITHISSGEILSVPETDKKQGLVETIYQGRNVAVFIQDLNERAERVDGHGA